MSDFIYNEDSRKHTLSGNPVGSVTQVIGGLSDFSMVPPAVLARKCQLGKEFHKAIELWALDDLFFDSLDPDLRLPMASFLEWEKMQPDRASAVYEVPLCNEVLGYCGKPDRVSRASVVDFKLRLYNNVSDPVQLAGYDGLIPDMRGRRMLTVVSFDIKGCIRVHNAKNGQAWSVFVAMLKHHRACDSFEKMIDGWKSHQKG